MIIASISSFETMTFYCYYLNPFWLCFQSNHRHIKKGLYADSWSRTIGIKKEKKVYIEQRL